MKSTVEQILNLFDELDAFESVELMERLAYRGYELKINRELEKKSQKLYGLHLAEYEEDRKIYAIKIVRTMYDTYKNMIDGGWEEPSLKEVKDFVENESLWKKKPIVIGQHDILERIARKSSDNSITFEILLLEP